LTACNLLIGQGNNVEGITFITARGDPPAESLAWSPTDANKILVTSFGLGSGSSNVYILDVATKEIQFLVKTQYGIINGMTWSPDGQNVIISADSGTKGYEAGGSWIFPVENYDSPQRIGQVGYSAWSPDGESIATISFIKLSGVPSRGVDVHLTAIESGIDEVIYADDLAKGFFGLSWSSNSRQLVFSLGDAGASNLYVLDTETRDVNQITQNSGGNDFPDWSPVQNVIVYTKSLFVDNVYTSKLHLLLPDRNCDVEIPGIDFAFSPSWSPDGRKIAFIGEDGIYILDTDIVFGKDIYQELCP
jgi:Tol biopolymer transport system component